MVCPSDAAISLFACSIDAPIDDTSLFVRPQVCAMPLEVGYLYSLLCQETPNIWQVFIIQRILNAIKNLTLVQFLNFFLAEESSDQTLLATWEWREGRLLTYELIAKYLVHNHVHYFFPPHAIHRARFRGSQSVDAAMQSR